MPEPPATILAFDIGIRNLAWCLMRGPVATGDPSPGPAQILGWQNYDLLAGAGHEAPATSSKVTCYRCSAAATFTNPTASSSPTCLRHCPPSHPPLKDVSGTVLKKLPALTTLRALAGEQKKSASKAKVLEVLRTRVSLPIEKVKLKKAVEHDLTLIHDSIRTFVAANAESFRQATQICLENQPVLKNPTMKTVQILLFATLRDLLQPSPPPLKLVHAGVKVKGKTTGDAGYKDRKEASEAKVLEVLGGAKIAGAVEWRARFQAAAKKSDLADAFLMCWDRCGSAVAGASGAATAAAAPN